MSSPETRAATQAVTLSLVVVLVPKIAKKRLRVGLSERIRLERWLSGHVDVSLAART
jgi:hypothetical protein